MGSIVIWAAGRNCDKFVDICITSVQKQTYKDFRMVIVDDASTDKTTEIIQKFVYSDNRLNHIINKTRLTKSENSLLYLKPDDDDIVVLLDLDDWLYYIDVLEIVFKLHYYHNKLVTYGSFKYLTTGLIEGSAYPSYIIESNLYRQFEWRAVHLQTFRGILWNNIMPDSLKDNNGNYLASAWDQAIMYPILEMCPKDKIQFISIPWYIYNDANPHNMMKDDKVGQINNEKIVRAKKPYSRIENI